MEIRRLTRQDDRSLFRSGNVDLDRFFQRFAGQNQFRHFIGTTHVAVEGSAILGYVTVAAAELRPGDLPAVLRKGLPGHPIPCLRIARLAVAEVAQGRGLGRELLRYALELARRVAADIGCAGVVVDAKSEAVDFYARYDFEPLEVTAGALGDRPRPTPMFLPMAVIAG